MAPSYLLLFLLRFLIIVRSLGAAAPEPAPISSPGCRNKCRYITVPYPFGFESNCFSLGFNLTCDESRNPSRLFINCPTCMFALIHTSLEGIGWTEDLAPYINHKVTDISPNGKMHISFTTFRDCYNSIGKYHYSTYAAIFLRNSSYFLSRSNSLFSISCSPQLGYLMDDQHYYVSGCVSECGPPRDPLEGANGTCNGYGCCQIPIPSGVEQYEPNRQNLTTNESTTTNCSYVFVADSNWFQYNMSYLKRTENFKVQVAIDWAIRDVGNCSDARHNMSSYACRSANHDCYDSNNGPGYL